MGGGSTSAEPAAAPLQPGGNPPLTLAGLAHPASTFSVGSQGAPGHAYTVVAQNVGSRLAPLPRMEHTAVSWSGEAGGHEEGSGERQAGTQRGWRGGGVGRVDGAGAAWEAPAAGQAKGHMRMPAAAPAGLADSACAATSWAGLTHRQLVVWVWAEHRVPLRAGAGGCRRRDERE